MNKSFWRFYKMTNKDTEKNRKTERSMPYFIYIMFIDCAVNLSAGRF